MSSEDKLQIRSFALESSTEVNGVVEKIKGFANDTSLIHLVSYMHNTVLVQNLKRELEKELEDVEIVLLKHEDKNKTFVTLFSLQDELENCIDIRDAVLQYLSKDNEYKNSSLNSYRTQLLKRYFTDHLTDLPNLYQLRKDLEAHDDYGLILIKIDNFQMINNFYGFIVGDYVIEYVGNYFKEHLKEYDVYRLSGSEFAFTIKHPLGFYELKDRLTELYERIKSIKLIYQENRIFIDFTMASTSNRDNSSIFSKVSMALTYAKAKGIPFWIYEDRMQFENEYARNLELSLEVRDAVENSRVIPYYQAIMDNKTGKTAKYECLARLVDKYEKILSPVLFIPIAKNIKIYNEVTKSIITKSFATFENNSMEFTINLSIEDIMSNEIFEFILAKLKSSKAASRVTFEILESEAIQDFKRVERFINEVRRYGAQIAIDDFGSGYSNFFYLTKMQPDYIKIDGALIENIDVDKGSLLVVETLVDFAKKLGIKTVAEYVHSSVVMDKVKTLGIDYSQGFYIDEPSVSIKDKGSL
ncbi:MAG: EAL domain-containing protein [Campylobacterales bacterium]|nr:EAL domain-containing protein [Campylobacterales bacterium]